MMCSCGCLVQLKGFGEHHPCPPEIYSQRFSDYVVSVEGSSDTVDDKMRFVLPVAEDEVRRLVVSLALHMSTGMKQEMKAALVTPC